MEKVIINIIKFPFSVILLSLLGKPWLEDGLYKDKWNEYSPEQLQYCIN